MDGNVRAFCDTLSLDSGAAKNVTVFASALRSGSARHGRRRDDRFRGHRRRSKARSLATCCFSRTTQRSTAPSAATCCFAARVCEIGPTAQIAGRVHVIGQRNADVAQGAKLGQPVEFEFRPLADARQVWRRHLRLSPDSRLRRRVPLRLAADQAVPRPFRRRTKSSAARGSGDEHRRAGAGRGNRPGHFCDPAHDRWNGSGHRHADALRADPLRLRRCSSALTLAR